jgi:hypothetical protein
VRLLRAVRNSPIPLRLRPGDFDFAAAQILADNGRVRLSCYGKSRGVKLYEARLAPRGFKL